jgi:hypothetical protein
VIFFVLIVVLLLLLLLILLLLYIIMGNKKNIRKRKNRGGDRLKEWRILQEFDLFSGVGSNKKKKVETENDSVTNTVVTDCNTNQNITDSNNLQEYNQPPVTTRTENLPTTTSCSEIISGRRIIVIAYFINKLKRISDHGILFDCSFKNMFRKSEIKKGLRSGFVFECEMCKKIDTAWTEPEISGYVNVNTSAVAGTISAGGGYATLQGAMGVHCMSNRTYTKHHSTVSEGWEISALQEMKNAAEEEIALARQRGDVDAHFCRSC